MTEMIVTTAPQTKKKSASASGSARKNNKSSSSCSALKRKNKKRVQKARISADFLKDLPEGVTHVPEKEEPAAGAKKRSKKEPKNPDIVKVGDFLFDIETVSKATLISMRKYLPPEEYRLLKNRKSARLCRLKRKNERGTM